MDVNSLITGSVVVVALGAFQLVRFVIQKQANGKTKPTSSPPPPDHGPCREELKQLTVGLYSFIEDSKANLVENRQFRQMFGEWMAREEGRREAQRENTGRFDTAQQPRP